jgi:hypothetical protein
LRCETRRHLYRFVRLMAIEPECWLIYPSRFFTQHRMNVRNNVQFAPSAPWALASWVYLRPALIYNERQVLGHSSVDLQVVANAGS